MIEIIVKDNSDYAFDKAIKTWKKQVSDSGVVEELKDRQYFKKPSEKRREKIRKRQYELNKEKNS